MHDVRAAEELNRRFGVEFFAELADDYGLPVGGWSVPMWVFVKEKAEAIPSVLRACAFRVVHEQVKRVELETSLDVSAVRFAVDRELALKAAEATEVTFGKVKHGEA